MNLQKMMENKICDTDWDNCTCAVNARSKYTTENRHNREVNKGIIIRLENPAHSGNQRLELPAIKIQ